MSGLSQTEVNMSTDCSFDRSRRRLSQRSTAVLSDVQSVARTLCSVTMSPVTVPETEWATSAAQSRSCRGVSVPYHSPTAAMQISSAAQPMRRDRHSRSATAAASPSQSSKAASAKGSPSTWTSSAMVAKAPKTSAVRPKPIQPRTRTKCKEAGRMAV